MPVTTVGGSPATPVGQEVVPSVGMAVQVISAVRQPRRMGSLWPRQRPLAPHAPLAADVRVHGLVAEAAQLPLTSHDSVGADAPWL